MDVRVTSPVATRRQVLRGGAALALGAGLAACGSSGSGGSSGNSTLNVAIFGSQAGVKGLRKVMAPFLKQHPKVTLNFTAIQGTDWNDFFAKVLTQAAGGNPPDVVQVASEGLQLSAAKHLIAPIDDYVKRDAAELKSYFSDVHPLLVEGLMYKGSLYCMPTDFNAGDMYFNTKLLTGAGVSLPPPDWTMDDFQAMARKLAGTKNTFAFDWVVRLWGSWTSFMYANDANLLTEGKYPGGRWLWDTFYPNDPAAAGRQGGLHWGQPTANDPAVVEALDLMVQLKKQGLSPQPDIGGGNTLQGLFASSRIGMTIGGGFWAGGLSQAGMKPGSFDVQFFPKWKVQKHLFGTGGYAMGTSARDKDLAWELMKYLTQPEGLSLLLNGNVSTPTRKSMLTASRYAPTGPAHWSVFYDTLTRFPNTTSIPAPPYYNALADALNQRSTEAMSTGNAKAALDGLQSDLESAAAAQGA